MKITIDENTKEITIEGDFTFDALLRYLNVSEELKTYKIVLKKEELSDKLWKGGLINVPNTGAIPCRPYNPFKPFGDNGITYNQAGEIDTKPNTNDSIAHGNYDVTTGNYPSSREMSKHSFITFDKDGIVTDLGNFDTDGAKEYIKEKRVEKATQAEVNANTTTNVTPEYFTSTKNMKEYINEQISKDIPNTNCADVKNSWYDKMEKDSKEIYNKEFADAIFAGNSSKDYTGKMFKRKAAEVGAKVHQQVENYINNTNDTL